MSGPAKLRAAVEFRHVLSSGTRTAGKLLIAHALVSQEEMRAGFVAGRAVGGAVARNRARRLMREAWRAVRSSVAPGTHVVFVSRPEIRNATMGEVAAEMAALLRRSGVRKL